MNKHILAAAVAASLVCTQALAHAHLEKADPRVGSTIGAPPSRIWLKFSEVIRPNASGVQLVAPDGKETVLKLSRAPKDARAVVAPLPPALPPGKYLVRWRALSPDGHRTQGDFSFQLKP